MKFFIAPVLVVAACYVFLLASGKGDVAVAADAPTQIFPGPLSKVYPVPAASEISWQPSFDANPDAIHDLSLHADK